VSREVGRFTGGQGGGQTSADHGGARDRTGHGGAAAPDSDAAADATRVTVERVDLSKEAPAGEPEPPAPDWAGEPGSGDPARDFDRLLDRFRDDLRDAARDHGVTAEQLRESRRRLSTAAAHIGALLRDPEQYSTPTDPDD
jgi:hypothetical protein